MNARLTLGLCAVLNCALLAPGTSWGQGTPGAASMNGAAAARNGSEAQGLALLHAIEAKFGGVMRSMYGWDEGAFERLYGYRDLPLAVLRDALAAPSYEEMLATFSRYQAGEGAVAAAKVGGRRSYDMAVTRPGEEAQPLVVQAKRDASKVLGDSAKDLVFVPVTPCTVWDTRYATNPTAAGTITDGATRSFQVWRPSAPADFTSLGGNPSCTEATSAFAGGTPAAVMMTVYASNASSNGWLTFYKYGDPDPSQATISVYYAPGPTRTQNVIAKVNGGSYDVSATSRFGSVDASASVVGYFMRSPATPLECNTDSIVVGTGTLANGATLNVPSAVCLSGYSPISVACAYAHGALPGLSLVQGGALPGSGITACSWYNGSGSTLNVQDFTSRTTCCRIP